MRPDEVIRERHELSHGVGDGCWSTSDYEYHIKADPLAYLILAFHWDNGLWRKVSREASSFRVMSRFFFFPLRPDDV